MLSATLISIFALQTRSVPTLTIRGPALVILLKDGCPCTRECSLSLNVLADACRGKLKFAALLNADGRTADIVARSAGLDFPVIADPRRASIEALGGKRALDIRLLDARGKVLGRWDGLSRKHVQSIEKTIDRALGVAIHVPLTPFTNLVKYGCEF